MIADIREPFPDRSTMKCGGVSFHDVFVRRKRSFNFSPAVLTFRQLLHGMPHFPPTTLSFDDALKLSFGYLAVLFLPAVCLRHLHVGGPRLVGIGFNE